MRTTSQTRQFKKDYKREARGRYASNLDADLLSALGLLAADHSLPQRYRDHELIGSFTDHRECHLRPDLLLIYIKPDEATLRADAVHPAGATASAGVTG